MSDDYELVDLLAESAKRGELELPNAVEIATLRIGDSIEVVFASRERSHRVASKGERAWARVVSPLSQVDSMLTAELLSPIRQHSAGLLLAVKPIHIARILRRRTF